MANDERLDDIWKACPTYDEMKSTEEQTLLAETPIDLLYQQAGISGEGMTHLVIDLQATDEQIMRDFRHWLTEYRKATGFKAPEKNFTKKHFNDWRHCRLLPYIDLVMIAKAEGKSLTNAQIGELIFPDMTGIDIVDKVRRTTKPKAEWLMTESTCNAMDAQLQAEASMPTANPPA